MSQHQQEKKDHWSAESYRNAASFVPQLTNTVIRYLDAQPTDHILDIGCGDGILTAQIAKSLSGTGRVFGLDASPSFITTAKAQNQLSNCGYALQDCTKLADSSYVNEQWDKVFSNAALHWILRQESTRQDVFRNVYGALKPGGRFVFEMGGKGNVGEMHAAFNAALLEQGLPLMRVQQVNPWFFPTTQWMSAALKDAGFDVEICELEYRPTKTTTAAEHDGKGSGLTGWLRLMGAQFLEAVEDDKREDVIKRVEEIVENVVTRDEDGSRWIGNVRLRAVAVKR
ncbi:hypothetical protein AMS68_000791 [Peltaster fructicola]|uniref:Methyltransferase domain-containing protein n=1 Tax=Peltaster fructicola TaxID=286661 RepID=A0A6H0XKL7_9PEZI|nr:hypothetical protein AMS68_000791 [Peltaster fructicola]